MGDPGRSMFVDEMPRHEAVEREGPVQFMRGAVCHRVGHDPARTRRGLETTCSPAGVDEQVLHRSEADDGRGVRSDINDTSPGPQHLRTGENREQFHRSRQLVFDHMEAAALCVGVEGVGACPHHQLTLVGLADINMNSAAHDHGVEHLFKQWTDQRLQWPALDWNGESGEIGQQRGMTGCNEAHLAGSDGALGGVYALDLIVPDVKACHFGALDDIHPKIARCLRIAPGHPVMFGDAATRLVGGTMNRIPDIRD